MSSPDERSRLDTIQIVRAVAALLVVLTHGAKEVLASGTTSDNAPWTYFVDHGQFGVDLFFVVSGFILTHISRSRLQEPDYPKHFLIRRIARVVPVYWFYLTATVFLAIALPQLKRHTGTNFTYVLASYLFVPFRNPFNGAPEPILGLGWTLNYEMYFYFVFFATIALFKERALKATLVYFTIAFIVGQLLRPQSLALSSWTGSMVFEFSYGIVIALAFGRRFRLRAPIAAMLFLLGVFSWLVVGFDSVLNIPLRVSYCRGVIWGLPAALIIASLTLGVRGTGDLRQTGLRFLIRVGDASYSLYLVHLFVMRVLTLAFLRVAGTLGGAYPIIYVTVFIAASILAAFASYRWLERPAEREWVKWLETLLTKRGYRARMYDPKFR